MSATFITRYGDLLIDLIKYRVLLGHEPIVLTYREYALLVYLATRTGRIVSRRRLLEDSLGRYDFGGLRMIDEQIRHLKSKLERGDRVFIESLDDGYRFVVPRQSTDGLAAGNV